MKARDRTLAVVGFLQATVMTLSAGLGDVTTAGRLVRLALAIGSAVVATVLWRRSNADR